MCKALRTGVCYYNFIGKAILWLSRTSPVYYQIPVFPPSDATFNKQPTPPHVGLLTQKKSAYHRDSEKFPLQSLQYLMADWYIISSYAWDFQFAGPQRQKVQGVMWMEGLGPEADQFWFLSHHTGILVPIPNLVC